MDEKTPDHDEPVIRTEDLTRQVEEKFLVKGISISVRRGEVVAITGPSGSGKSSFLRLLNRLDEPTAGTVYLDGRDYRHIPPRELRRRVGMVMQSPNLFPGTVAENINFGPAQRGESIPRDQLDRLLQRVGLEGYADRETRTLSGGEAQRVSLARTLANRPDVLLLDEPTSSLDQAAEEEVEDLLRQIFGAENLTCLIVTHDLDQAVRLASRAILLKEGRLVADGPAKEVIRARGAVR